MWLLDANMDVHLTDLLREYGIRREAATRRGWGGLTNGELVEAATKAGFTCILARDRLFADSVGRLLDEHSNFSIVVVHPDLLPRDFAPRGHPAKGTNSYKSYATRCLQPIIRLLSSVSRFHPPLFRVDHPIPFLLLPTLIRSPQQAHRQRQHRQSEKPAQNVSADQFKAHWYSFIHLLSDTPGSPLPVQTCWFENAKDVGDRVAVVAKRNLAMRASEPGDEQYRRPLRRADWVKRGVEASLRSPLRTPSTHSSYSAKGVSKLVWAASRGENPV